MALLQLAALPIQCFGKIGLLGAIVTAGFYADREAEGDPRDQAVAPLLTTGYWIFVFFLGA